MIVIKCGRWPNYRGDHTEICQSLTSVIDCGRWQVAELKGWPHRNLIFPYNCDQLWHVAQIHGWPHRNLTVPYKCNQLWQMAELQVWPYRNLTVPDKCDQLWQVAELQVWPTSLVVAYQIQHCKGTMPDYSVYQNVGTLMYWTRDEISMICLRVPFQKLLMSRKCLSGTCQKLSFEEICSWMRISGSTAMMLVCRVATQTKLAALAYDAAFYVSLHERCGMSVGLTVSIAG